MLETCVCVCVCVRERERELRCVQLFATPWITAHQAPQSIGLSQARILEWVAISFSTTPVFLPGITLWTEQPGGL